MEERPLVDGFLLGLPKCGTTWLAEVLSQNPSIDFSNPKEPNILSSHDGTFDRIYSEPDYESYLRVFSGNGFRIDGSVHTFSCPLAPERVFGINPQARFLICLRQPVERALSHWKMIRDSGADRRGGADWYDFETAWADQRLKEDSIWSDSMARWLEIFEKEQFLFIDSIRMREEPENVLSEITSHFDLESFEYDCDSKKESNTARSRKRMTPTGNAFKAMIRLIPQPIRNVLAKPLQRRSLNIYDLPIISIPGELVSLTKEHYEICAEEVIPDLRRFEEMTGFQTSHWQDAFDIS